MNESALDIAKHLAINCRTKREREQYIIEHASYFQVVYKTQKTNLASEKFNDEASARNAAVFSTLLSRIRGSKSTAPVRVMAYIQDDKGRAHEAVVEEITQLNVDDYINAEVPNGQEKRAS